MDKTTFESLNSLCKRKKIEKEKISLLKKMGLYENGALTKKGLIALEPYRVKKAVIVGAGFGSRMVPITLTTPKPLVKVNGIRIIDTLIDNLIKAGIIDITIVRGYLKDKFNELLKKYPFIKFIDNDKYNKENNISSVVLACDLLENAYLCEADLLVMREDVITEYQFETNNLCSKVDFTDDWCFDVDENGIIYNYRKGGKHCYQYYGITYWTKEDAALLRKKILEMYTKKENRNEFYEMCYYKFYKNLFKVHARVVKKGSIIEIDSFKELQEIDSSYKTSNGF